MHSNLAKKILVISSIIFMAFFVFQPIHNVNAGLVPCGTTANPTPCTTCDLLILFSSIINFAIFTIAPAVAVLLYLISGFMILLGGANPGLIANGKNIFKTTTIGLIIIFMSWMITNTVLKSLAGEGPFTGKWNEVTCTGASTTPPGGQKYSCNSSNQCVADTNGSYTTSNCGGACTQTAQHYSCSNNQCVASATGQYAEATCGGSCGAATGGTCKGTTCSDSGLNICGSTSANCSKDTVNGWSTQISAAVNAGHTICSGIDTTKAIKAIMSQESGGVPQTAGDGQSAGLMQLKPATASNYKSQCGVPASTTIDFAWLNNSANGQAQICMAIEEMKQLVGACGCDVRQLAAGYNGGGPGACAESTNCGSAAAGQGGQCTACSGETFTRRWECLWDDNTHTTCNADRSAGSLSVTRAYVPKVSYCYGQF